MAILDFLKDIISKTKSSEEAHFQEEIFSAVGVEYNLPAVQKLAAVNPDWRKKALTLVNEGKAMQRIFRYNFIQKPVQLIPEPKNPHDKNAVLVQIAGEKVGYIGRDDNAHVKNILQKHEVKFISAWISGGEYKVVSENGDTEKQEDHIRIRVKIGYQ